MLFRKTVDKMCQYCQHCKVMDEKLVACDYKKKCMKVDDKCRHFEYDPLKRTPSKPKAQDFSKYDEYDYSL